MSSSAHYLSPSDAAERLGISPKALRLYEQRGLIAPVRTAAGWRTYGPVEMTRAGEIAALRALGLSLAQVARVLKGEAQELAPALAAHQAKLEAEARRIAETVEKVRNLRAGLAGGEPPGLHELTRLARPAAEIVAAFDLPWPWGGERFELRDIRPLNYIIGLSAAARLGSPRRSPNICRERSSSTSIAPPTMPPRPGHGWKPIRR
ncbi:MerR family transcriptional regulator [Neorhizobium sp. SHOUNA12A]|uniref:MerR family transcriptional regulator n=1 Tax=Neorhizobium sp. SHOUNA12A TaxID=2908923 RepID=UPI001FF3AC5C|nr:MerR family transcriptional regulator [Neorhizobium sp. SHOUNA12A]MCJ9748153.1 MerR family transcriptional regulator [Neorhizobium sp. SHOUNA12A]